MMKGETLNCFAIKADAFTNRSAVHVIPASPTTVPAKSKTILTVVSFGLTQFFCFQYILFVSHPLFEGSDRCPVEDVDNETKSTRDTFVDLVRAASLTVVVVWHWAFTIIIVEPDGMYPTNPVGETTGLWLLTWLFQVMPLFFFVGGWANMSSWKVAAANGTKMSSFVFRRVKKLAVPALGLVILWWVPTVVLTSMYDARWLWDVTILVLSPLWFAAVYLLIVLLMPLWVRLHNRFGILVPVWLAGLVAVVDVARFTYGVPWVGWLNMIFMWGLAHQVGFFYDKLVALDHHQKSVLVWGGLFGLIGLVWAGLYPASMVGVPGEDSSNMAPPSLAIVALLTFQVGVLMLIRPWVMKRINRPKWKRFTGTLSTYSMPLYLLHTTGMVIAVTVVYMITGARYELWQVSGWWWLTRPLAILLPLIATLPLLALYGLISNRRTRNSFDINS